MTGHPGTERQLKQLVEPRPNDRPLAVGASLNSVASEEVAWERENPDGQIEKTDTRLVLWNFAVGSEALKAQHVASLIRFTEYQYMAGKNGSKTRYFVDGYASKTGSEAGNIALAKARAQAVAKYLITERRVLEQSIKTDGFTTPNGDDAPAALARQRNVTINRLIPTPPPTTEIPFISGERPAIDDGSVDSAIPTQSIKFSFAFEGPPIVQPKLTYRVSMAIECAGELTPENASGLAFETTIETGAISREAKAQITSWLQAKTEVGVGAEGPQASLAAEFGLSENKTVSVGVQEGLLPIYCEWEAILPDLNFDTSFGKIKVTLSIKAKFSFGPGPESAARFAALTASAPVPIVLASLTVGFWALFFTAFQQANVKGQKTRKNLSVRFGFAARIALELEDTLEPRHITETASSYAGEDLEWFREGALKADDVLKAVDQPTAQSRRIELQKRYAPPGANGSRPPYETIRDTVFQALGGIDGLEEGSLMLPGL